jgi:Spy/CpxP family protein refolding chaperone
VYLRVSGTVLSAMKANLINKVMRNLIRIGAVGLVMCLAIPAIAQDTRKDKVDAEQRLDARLDKLEKELDLSKEQKAQLKEIHKDTWEKKQALKTQMQANNQEKKERVKAVLTPEQYAKMKEIKKEKAMQKRSDLCTCGKGQKPNK